MLVSDIFSFLHNVFKRMPSYSESFNFLAKDKISDQSSLKDFADDKINVTYVTNFIMGREKNIVGKGENASNQHFLLFPQ